MMLMRLTGLVASLSVGLVLAGPSRVPDPDFSGAGPHAARLLGDIGFTTVPGTVSEEIATPIQLPIRENIYGPFEAGFGAQQEFILEGLGCNPGSKGYVDGGIDTQTAENMVAHACGVVLPRKDASGNRISLLDSCGGHTKEYHLHERLRCLYKDEGHHSTQIGRMLDGRGLYGKWESFTNKTLPELDACGGHWGPTPVSDKPIYHYHVQAGPPFTLGCYGPNPDNTPVSVAQCRKLYPANQGCGGSDITDVTTKDGTTKYDHWCPCYDADGSNVGTKTLPLLAGADKDGPGKDYVEPAISKTSDAQKLSLSWMALHACVAAVLLVV